MSLSFVFNIIQPLVADISRHKIFSAITSIERLRRFAQIHVFAVWDFMLFLQALQQKLQEGNDAVPDGNCLSYFELYLEAMRRSGADRQPINAFIHSLRHDPDLTQLLTQDNLPQPAKRFLTDSFELINKDSHIVASAFAFGREYIASITFPQILQQLTSLVLDESNSLQTFMNYFRRHIDLYGGKHGEKSKTIVTTLCENDESKWDEAAEAAFFSLKSQLELLNGIYTSITTDNI